MQLCLNDSFMIRKIIVAAVPAALLTVGMSLAISEPASSQMRGGGMGGATNTNQVYPSNRRSLVFQPGTIFGLSSGGARGGHGAAGGGVHDVELMQFQPSTGSGGGAGRG